MLRTCSLTHLLAATILLALAVVGCDSKKTSDDDLVMVSAADAPAVLAGRMNLLGSQGKSGVWVDPRSEADYRKGHIPRAVSMPFATARDRHEELTGHRVIIVYGEGYRDVRAEGMAKRLIELGHGDVRVLHGGLEAWVAAGNPVESDG